LESIPCNSVPAKARLKKTREKKAEIRTCFKNLFIIFRPFFLNDYIEALCGKAELSSARTQGIFCVRN
jgi:hypothetical protein